jgi:hypothetical protein
MLKATIITSFKAIAKTGTRKGQSIDRHLYSVAGTPEELAAFKTAMGNFYAEDADGKALYYSNNFAGNTATLIISKGGKVNPDMSEFVRASSLATQFPGALGDAIAAKAADQLLGSSHTAPQPVAQPRVEPETEE